MQKELLFYPNTRFYHINMKRQKNSEIFLQMAEFYSGMGGQTSPWPGNSGTRTSVQKISSSTNKLALQSLQR